MRNRRFAQVSTSDDDEDDAVPIQQSLQQKRLQKPTPKTPNNTSNSNNKNKKKKKKKKLDEDDDDDFEAELEVEDEDEDESSESDSEDEKRKRKRKKKNDDDDVSGSGSGSEDEKRKRKKTSEDNVDDVDDGEEEGSKSGDEEEDEPVDARPVGEPTRVSGKGKSRKTHYEAFDYDGNQYDLEDPVLITPESSNYKVHKPYVAIIKDVTQDKDGNVMMTGQWFYRPEEAEKKGGGNWQSDDTRELFYSFHRDDVPAEAVMHKCVVHFVPLHKQLPNRKQYPGFIVRKVYDIQERRLWKLTDKDYEDKKQQEIDVLVQKTMKRLVDLPDVEPEENVIDQLDQSKSKRTLRRKNISPLDVSRDEEGTTNPDQNPRAETPGSCLTTGSEYYSILVNANALTGDTHRDKWLDRLLQAVHNVCSSSNGIDKDNKVKSDANGHNQECDIKSSEAAKTSHDKSAKDDLGFVWPDAAVVAVSALEKATHDSLASDFQKYNQKCRSLMFNLKSNLLLARRLLNGELEPSKILNMSPNELKEGLIAEETEKKEPDESERMQMTDTRCSRCSELKVGVRDIIQAGHGARYHLECIACGHDWYASQDDATRLTIDALSTKDVGTVPLATSKFEQIEKQLASPGDPSDKDQAGANDVLKKTSEPYTPVLETQK